jgi:hypothetical protein
MNLISKLLLSAIYFITELSVSLFFMSGYLVNFLEHSSSLHIVYERFLMHASTALDCYEIDTNVLYCFSCLCVSGSICGER